MFRTSYPNKVFDYMAAGRPTLVTFKHVSLQPYFRKSAISKLLRNVIA
jgi:hypothetical protein